MQHGLLLIDKPSGITSHDVVHRVRRIFQTSQVGHTGTLDPIASGLMVVLIGEATKLSQYILDEDKGYVVKVRFGVTTDTLDRAGKVLTENGYEISIEKVDQVIRELQGDLDLPIPMYSAKKIDGKKLYELARENIQIEIPRKIMSFYQIVKIPLSDHPMEAPFLNFQVFCKKGGFIRSWVQALGEKLGSGAIVQELRRIYSAPYHVDSAITLEELQKTNLMEISEKSFFIPLEKTLPHWKDIHLDGFYLKLLLNGQIAQDLEVELQAELKKQAVQGFRFFAQETQKLVAIAEVNSEGQIQLRRGFRY